MKLARCYTVTIAGKMKTVAAAAATTMKTDATPPAGGAVQMGKAARGKAIANPCLIKPVVITKVRPHLVEPNKVAPFYFEKIFTIHWGFRGGGAGGVKGTSWIDAVGGC
jgi:hypothetical protein